MKDLKNLKSQLRDIATKLRPYRYVIYLSFVALIYGVSYLRIQSLSSQQPTDAAISGQVQAAHIPKIDPQVVTQLNSLEDNSVSVKTLFDQARNNPFGQ